MEENWIMVFKTERMMRAEVIREKLDEAGIPAVIVNKQDSSIPVFAATEVHVPVSDALRAQIIVENEESAEQS